MQLFMEQLERRYQLAATLVDVVGPLSVPPPEANHEEVAPANDQGAETVAAPPPSENVENEFAPDSNDDSIAIPPNEVAQDLSEVTPAEAALIYQALFNSSLASMLLPGLVVPGSANAALLGSAPMATPTLPAFESPNFTPQGSRLLNPQPSFASPEQNLFLPLRATTDLEFRAGRYRELADDFLLSHSEHRSVDEASALDYVFTKFGEHVSNDAVSSTEEFIVDEASSSIHQETNLGLSESEQAKILPAEPSGDHTFENTEFVSHLLAKLQAILQL